VFFSPEIKKEGSYKVYVYLPKVSGISSKINILVNNTIDQKEVVVDMKTLKVQGQTEGEWIGLGQYNFPAGNKSSVAISAKDADGIVLADAVLFVPQN